MQSKAYTSHYRLVRSYWQAEQDLNLQPVALEATALPIELSAFVYVAPDRYSDRKKIPPR